MIYRNSKGKFISHQEWLYLQIKEKETMNNSRRRKHTQSAAELNAEQVSSKVEIAEGTQVLKLGADFDVDEYKRKVEEFEKSMEDAFIPQDKVIQEKLKEPVVIKTPGFFTTWFKKWF
jgi:uncharacterized membrane protein YkoI